MSTFDIVRAMGSRRRPRWRAAGALTLARGARCECSHRAFAANLVRDGGGMAEDSRRVCTHRESSAMDVAATATVRLATCANVGDASTCRRWPAPQIAHIGPPPSPRPPRPGRDPHPSSLFGLVPPASPSETAPRVYTRDGLSAGGEASMPCQQAKRFGGEGRCREPPDVCTREMGFLASAELYWDFLPKIASRVYTRDSLSGKDWPQLPINRGNAPAEHGPCQKSRPACTRGAHFLPVGGVGRRLDGPSPLRAGTASQGRP